MTKRSFLILIPFVAIALTTFSSARADDAQVEAELAKKGAEFKHDKALFEARVTDATAWTDDDFRKLAQLTHITSLSFGKGVTDAQVALLAPLTEVNDISTNAIAASDAGVASFANLKKLHRLKLFHPGKSFTGVGLAKLAELPNLTSLTVAGSTAFADEGMAAVATLPHLTEFRSWHAGFTSAGVAKLKDSKLLNNLNLGQRLSYQAPTSVSDDTLAIVSSIPTIQFLQLSEARLSLTALSQLKNLPKLSQLTLDGIQISEEDLKKLEAELPKVKIKYTAPTEAYQRRIKALFPAASSAK